MNAQRALEVPGLRVGNHCTRPNFILEIAKNPWVSRGVGKMSVIRLRHTPAIISFQIVNDVFIKKNYKFIVSFDRYKGVSPNRAKNDTEKMVNTINKNDIRR